MLAQRGGDARIAVIGEMLELGDHAADLHEDVGARGAGAASTCLIAVGGAPATALADAGGCRPGWRRASVRHFATSDEAAEAVAALVDDGDVVLVKGSRGVRTDRVVDRLKAERG